MRFLSRFMQEASRYLPAIYFLPRDFLAHLPNEAHRSHPSTHAALRFLYVRTRGSLRLILLWIFRRLRPYQLIDTPKYKGLIADIRRTGIAVVPQFLDPDKVARIRDYLTEQPGFRIGAAFSKSPARFHTMSNGLKLEYAPVDILLAPGVKQLVESKEIYEIAAEYLGCQPIFTGVAAWWSLSDATASEADLSGTAQKFHFDYDWPAFIKFFIYLTDVCDGNGPFTFVCGTHEKKHEWRNGRFEDDYIHMQYGDAVRPMLGAAGDMLIADTAGYHKGERVKEGARLILQLEFAISRLGASCQYELLPRHMKPASFGGHTFDIFAG
jgi:ectoine hydroxylase-related dioxygenase (phytanoyl-CoA dioxygenase family)